MYIIKNNEIKKKRLVYKKTYKQKCIACKSKYTFTEDEIELIDKNNPRSPLHMTKVINCPICGSLNAVAHMEYSLTKNTHLCRRRKY